MINIFIKTLNRPLFLERCILSILQNVDNFNKIIILDDGTPQKYLTKLKLKYPEIEFRKSEFYDEKSKMIEDGLIDRSKFTFPGKFWGREISNSDMMYNLVVEDDMYFTEKIDLKDTLMFMEQHQLLFFKFSGLGNKFVNQGNVLYESGDHQLIKPDLVTINPTIYKLIVGNKFKHLSLLAFFKLYYKYYKNFALKYYTIYSVAGAIFRKDYFEYIWNDISTLNENVQIEKTLEYYKNNNINLQVGRTSNEMVYQSFISSATNEYKGIKTSIFAINKAMNEAWYNDKVNALYNFPNDYTDDMIKLMLEGENGDDQLYKDWKKWFNWVRVGYEKIGHQFK